MQISWSDGKEQRLNTVEEAETENVGGRVNDQEKITYL